MTPEPAKRGRGRPRKQPEPPPFVLIKGRSGDDDIDQRLALAKGNSATDYTPSGPLYDMERGAAYLSVSVSHLQTLLSQGVGPRRTVLPSRVGGDGKKVHFAKADLDAYINAFRA